MLGEARAGEGLHRPRRRRSSTRGAAAPRPGVGGSRGDASRASARRASAWPRAARRSWERHEAARAPVDAFEEVLIPPVALRADGNLAYFEAPGDAAEDRFARY